MTDPKHNPESNPAVLVEVTRGTIVESMHFGVVAVADVEGNLLAWAGDPLTVTHFRSSSKPVQVLPLVESGAADHFGFTAKELAVMCGSHGGEDIHVDTVQAILDKIGLDSSALACGAHAPYDKEANAALKARGEEPSAMHNNCSGKHAGMLALACYHNWPTEGYQRGDHPVQKAMLHAIADFTGLEPDTIAIGVDGCGVPTFGVPVAAMAVSFARLAQPNYWPEPRRSAVARVTQSMTAHPELVAARQDRIDTDLMRATNGTLIAKVGAESVYCAARLATEDQPALGFALKLLDGDATGRARHPAVVEGLRQAGFLSEEALELLEKYWMEEVLNRPGDVVGMVRPAFTLSVAG